MDFAKLKILVIGDIMLDEYIQGTVTRISPEAPIPILDKQKTWYCLGGAGNVAKNISSLGAYILQMGRVGFDTYGEMIHKELEDSKIDAMGIVCDEAIPTTVKTRFVCGNQSLLRVDYETRTSIESTEVGEAVLDYIDSHLDQYDAVIVSDYNKGMIFPALAYKIGELAYKHNVISVVDTHKTDWNMFRKYTCVTPNIKELGAAVGTQLSNIEDIKHTAEYIRRQFEMQYMLVTMSEKGMLLVTPDNTIHIPVEHTEVIDVTGAGDTALAVFTLALASGMTAEESAKLSNKAASMVVSKLGTATLTPVELFK